MSSEILSQNDIDLLLGGGGADPAKVRERGTVRREAELYDFRRPHRVSKERLRTLQAMYERFAKSIEGWITGRVRDQVELTLQSVEQLGFADFALSLPTPCCSFLLNVENSGGEQGVIDFGHELGCFLVDRMLGGRGEPVILERGFTPIERMVIRTVADRVAVSLREVWADYVGLDLTLNGFESIPEILRATGGAGPVLVATLEVLAGGRTSLMSLCIPMAVLDTFFADSGRPRRQGGPGTAQEREDARRRNAESLRASRVPISIRLPDFRVPMRALAEMEVGSVISTGLSQQSVVDVYLNGQRRFTGQPARVGRRLAVRVVEPVRPIAGAESGPGDEPLTPDP